jgi:hypothetical protein
MLTSSAKVVAVAFTIFLVACSGDQPGTAMRLPAAPSSFEPGGSGGVSRPMIVNFPSRADTVEFRQQLETKYAAGLGRPVSQVFVDMEGEVVWIQEYDRYRVNGCDHTTATQYTLSQIDGAAASPVCSLRQFPETATYPPRNEVVDFRRQLGTKSSRWAAAQCRLSMPTVRRRRRRLCSWRHAAGRMRRARRSRCRWS